MPDILHEFIVKAPPERVFPSFATAAGLASWWTKSTSGDFRKGGLLHLDFGPDHDWQAHIVRLKPPHAFELEVTRADAEWESSRVGCELIAENQGTTRVRFWHSGWRQISENYRFSSYCWAMYLRLLKRNVETGEIVPYEKRLDA